MQFYRERTILIRTALDNIQGKAMELNVWYWEKLNLHDCR